MTEIEEIKQKLAEYTEKNKKDRLAKKKATSEPYGGELQSAPQQVPELTKSVPTPQPKPVVKAKKPKVDNPDLERFSGKEVTLTQEEFKAVMKHAEVGQQVIEAGGVPQPVQPPIMVPQEAQPVPVLEKPVPDAPQPSQNAVGVVEEQEVPEGTFEEIAQPKKKRWFRRGGEQEEYVGEDKLSSRPTILYYDTDNTCKLVTGKMTKDGSLQIDERLFDFTEGQPSILSVQRGKGRSSSHPFYILRYDNMNPINVNEYPDSNPTPEQASRLVELRTLETLSRIEGGKMKKGPLIILMLVAFFGGFVLKMMLGLLGIW